MARSITLDNTDAVDKLFKVAQPESTAIESQPVAMSEIDQQLSKLLVGVEVTLLDDYQIKVILPGIDRVTGQENVAVVLREMDGNDLEAMENMSGGGVSKTMRSISRLCISWGDLPGVEPVQVRKARSKHITILGAVFARFLT